MSPSGLPSQRLVVRRALLPLVVAASAAALAAPAQAASGTQFDSFRLAGGTRYTVVVTEPTQVAGLPAWAAGYHRYCATTTGPVLRYRIKYSAPGDVSSYGISARYAKVGSTAYTAFGYSGVRRVDLSTAGAPKTVDQALNFARFLETSAGVPSPTEQRPLAPRSGLYDLQLIPQVQYVVELAPGITLFTFPQNQPALAAQLDFRVVPPTDPACGPGSSQNSYLRAQA